MLLPALAALLALVPAGLVRAAPVVPGSYQADTAVGTFWMENIQRAGTVPFADPGNYTIFRNVLQFGADRSGNGDAAPAINQAIAAGNRCGLGCDSSTVTPAIVYFPPGTYRIKSPIQMYYYTQLIGDANQPPVILGDASFAGMALIDSDPYEDDGANWFTNQNNFFRQVRNFVIDVTQIPGGGTGIHWQVAQATSLQNIKFNLGANGQGIFMDNGSGGFMSDLTFQDGKIGAFLGSQQFTTRNMTFTNCKTAIYMNWNWGWTISGITVSGGNVGIDMANSPANQTVGSVVITDSVISSSVGVNVSFSNTGNVPANGGQLIITNVDMSHTSVPVQHYSGEALLSSPGLITNWVAGVGYTGTQRSKPSSASLTTAPSRAAQLLDNTGRIFTRSKPQYQSLQASDFVSAKTSGCHGDGSQDDTANIQKFLNTTNEAGKIAYFDHGAYLVTDTIYVPPGTKIVGEIWPMILAKGFNSGSPKPVFQVGQPGDSGTVEIQDLIFETQGSTPDAIMIEWNLNSQQGQAGMWDSHVRLGGSAGTGLQYDTCAKNPNATQTGTDSSVTNCEAAFLMFHATQKSSGVYLENTWFWVADHELDQAVKPAQISLYNARGVLIESQGPVWLWGTASEHSIIYNYQFNHVNALYAGFIQSETPYMQPNPQVPTPFSFNSQYDDPTFTICNGSGSGAPCKDAWGLRIYNSQNVLIYGTGLYSFFQNYEQTCVPNQNCQEHMIRIQNSNNVQMYAVSTKAAVNMIDDQSTGAAIKDADNRSNFCATIAYYLQQAMS